MHHTRHVYVLQGATISLKTLLAVTFYRPLYSMHHITFCHVYEKRQNEGQTESGNPAGPQP